MNKDELLKIFSAYLPYKLRVSDLVHNPDFILDEDNLGDVLNDAEHLKTIKPYLYDLSYLTKEIEHEGERFVPILKLGIHRTKDDVKRCPKEFVVESGCNIKYRIKGFYNYTYMTFSETLKLLEWHFNVFGLPESEYINKATLTNK